MKGVRVRMKKIRKITGVLVAIAILIFGSALSANAADGVITFTDLQTKVGDTFTINCRVATNSRTLSQINLEMSYNPEYVQFMSGDGVDASVQGKLKYSGTASGTNFVFSMELQALKEGQIRMTLDQANVTDSAGMTIDCQLGYSDIRIGAGDPSRIVAPPVMARAVDGIMVDNISYSLTEDFQEVDLPRGFIIDSITYNGEEFKGATQVNGAMQLGYLKHELNGGKFFIYNAQNSSFVPFEQVLVSAESYIILLHDEDGVVIPRGFEEVKLTVEDYEYKAWQDTKNTDFYLIYAQNELGEKGFYRYDSKEQTYQRYAMENVEEPVEEEAPAKEGLIGKLLDYMSSHVEQVIVGIALLTILFLVLIIILGVKLSNRNRELDGFYDEYGIDLEEEEVIPEPRRKKIEKEEFDMDDFDFMDDFEVEEKDENEKRSVKKAKKKTEAEEEITIEFIDL